MENQISIIGFGNFGKLVAKHLVSTGTRVLVNDSIDKTPEAQKIGAKFTSLEEACRSKIIILAVPMENLVSILETIKDKISQGTLVLDVCSLKIFSCRAMQEILPKNIEIIGTHPLFGPQSAPNSIKGMKIALVNVRANPKTIEKTKNFCEKLGLKVILTTAQEHDRQMAFSQALTHFIGRVCNKTNITRIELSTKTFDDLMNIVEIIKNDTPALFNNMQTMNPFAEEVRENFVRSASQINNELNFKRVDNVECKQP
ncbi:prephenate dehydrogenase/arogenate dehydrogenase family protein [Candidatus Pacearchaeota archaeon]|nr:prephenate dehydrogenase/arogenate dehydrogenase family protein [Candidatus Pacearchaeota archaeon]